MRLFGKFRFSLATIMMLVVMAAACSALFAKGRELVPATGEPSNRFDFPFLFVLAIVLTALALGALKRHTAVQMMLQVTVACLGYLSLIGVVESEMDRPLLYWFQCGFCVLVTIPLLARRAVKSKMERGPRRTWWKATCETFLFASFTMVLVLFGLLIQYIGASLAVNIIGIPVPAATAPPVPVVAPATPAPAAVKPAAPDADDAP